MPEPGMGSAGSRSGAGMGGGGGYAGADLDWGSSPEGSEGTTAVKMGSFYMDDDPEYEAKKHSAVTMPSDWMAQNIYEDESTQTAGINLPQGGTSYMSPYEAPSFEENEATYRQSGGNTIRSFLGQGKQDITGEVIGRLKATPNLSKEFMRALTVDGLPNFVIDEMDSDTAASYHAGTDTVTLGEHWSIDDLAHELSHRAVMRNTPGLDKIQMPNVQALYEVGGNAFNNYQVTDVDGNLVNIGPHYGAQGEMVTSRAGTAQNLIDAMQYGGFSGTHQGGTAGTGGWADAYGTYDFDKQRWDIDYMKAMTQSPTDNPLDHAAIKAGWTATTPLNPMAEGLQQYHTAHPTYSVPGTGNWKGGYENWMALQNEMPTKSYGAAYDSQGKVFGPASQTQKRSGGLWNTPMQGAHALVQEFMIRNSDMLEHGKYNYDVREAMYNKFVAQELQRPRDPYSTRIEHFKYNPAPGTENVPDYAPQSKIGLIEKLELAKEFWDKVSEYWDQYDQYMGPSYMGPSQ